MAKVIHTFSAKAVDRIGNIVNRIETGELNRAYPGTTPLATPIETYIGKCKETISAISGDTPGSGDIDVYNLNADSGDVEDRGFDLTVYNLGSVDYATDDWVICYREPISGQYFIDCCIGLFLEDDAGEIQTLGETKTAGTSDKVARADHDHSSVIPTDYPSSPAEGQIWIWDISDHMYFTSNGSDWELEKTFNKGIPDGYCPLDSSTLVPTSVLGSGTADSSTYLRGDQTWASVSSSNHNILSSTHSDSTTATVVRGDIIYGNSTPAWDRLPIGSANQVLTSDGTDVSWSDASSNPAAIAGRVILGI